MPECTTFLLHMCISLSYVRLCKIFVRNLRTFFVPLHLYLCVYYYVFYFVGMYYIRQSLCIHLCALLCKRRKAYRQYMHCTRLVYSMWVLVHVCGCMFACI